MARYRSVPVRDKGPISGGSWDIPVRKSPDRLPTADELSAMVWWNGMSRSQRAAALAKANTAVIAEAWAHHKKLNKDRP
jgi:hypothetical protein